jgi:type VI secretion system protein ImpB
MLGELEGNGPAAGREDNIMAKNSNSGQKFISRNRKPRVHITYEDPYNSEEKVELPFVMGVMADLSGNASAVEKPDIDKRKFLDTDMDNFDARMAAIEPAVAFKVDNKLGGEEGTKLSVNLKFNKFEDFEPAAIARQVPALEKLLAAREQLKNLLGYMDGRVAAEDTLKKLLADPQLMSALKQKLEERPASEEKPE